MTNNDILRNLRYTFDFDDAKIITIFAQADLEVTEEQVLNWLKKEDDEGFDACNDEQFACFLNGLINDLRGKKEGAQPAPEKILTNNLIFRKLKIALDLKDSDILDLLSRADFRLSKHELSAFFRKVGHKHYRICQDQVLRNFLQGLYLKHRK